MQSPPKEKLRLFATLGEGPTPKAAPRTGVEAPAALTARPRPWTALSSLSALSALPEEQLLIEQAAGLRDEAGLAPTVAPWFGLYQAGYRVRSLGAQAS